MLAIPRPTELMTLIHPERAIEKYRDFLCDRYDACLDEAVERRWTSWTCAHCPVAVRRPASRSHRREP